ncbi:hypothetical protein BST96_04990 [Oceanicoccus sagamiensis]|uniref:Uncharacterized protein n=2 Tax=Oceanicoccus sagamiensis TaxID=716816 RepID=A0A1X9N8N1_9GAMM|nr:hypothetical protein BST96_04990 [Oceanicoccus sagamiensis]
MKLKNMGSRFGYGVIVFLLPLFSYRSYLAGWSQDSFVICMSILILLFILVRVGFLIILRLLILVS